LNDESEACDQIFTIANHWRERELRLSTQSAELPRNMTMVPNALFYELMEWFRKFRVSPVLHDQGLPERLEDCIRTPVSAKEGRSEWPHGKATNGEVMEEFLTRDEAVWALIDEVRAFRQGVCCLTHSRDPIEIITDKYWGISSREHIARQREIIAKAKATVGPTAKDGA
jgi:hypothetical protein